MAPSTAVAMRYESEEVWFPCSLDVLGWDEKFHELMLNDRLRMKAYQSAIQSVVQPGMVVVDLGTGTGILAKWALEAGAAIAYGIEVNAKILAKAEKNLCESGLGNRFKPVHALSYDVELPKKADLIVSELIGNIGDNEDCPRILADARDRFLKPEGRMLPARVTTYFVPVCSPKTHAQIKNGRCMAVSEVHDLQTLLSKLEAADPFGLYYDVILPRRTYLSAPREARVFDFASGAAETSYRVNLDFPIVADGLLTGFKGYFIADLGGGILLDISGDDIVSGTASDSWKHCYLPLAEPVAVRGGDQVLFNLARSPEYSQSSPFSCRYRWQAMVKDQAGSHGTA